MCPLSIMWCQYSPSDFFKLMVFNHFNVSLFRSSFWIPCVHLWNVVLNIVHTYVFKNTLLLHHKSNHFFKNILQDMRIKTFQNNVLSYLCNLWHKKCLCNSMKFKLSIHKFQVGYWIMVQYEAFMKWIIRLY